MMKKILSTMLGGLISLLPMVVILFLLGKVFGFTKWLTQPLNKLVPQNTAEGSIALNLLALVLFLIIILLLGYLSRSLFGQKMESSVDSFLVRFIPGYTFIRGLNSQINGSDPDLPVVLVRQDDGASIGFEIERNSNGWVVVFLPGSPQPWSGSVIHMTADRVVSLTMTYPQAIYMFQQMGKGSASYLPDVNTEIEYDQLIQGHHMPKQ